MSAKKRIVSVIVTVAVIVGAGAGISTAVRATTQNGKVMVVPVSDLNYGGYDYGNYSSMSGQVTADAAQNVYVNDTETVESVSVTEGQSVKKGDVLLTFDTNKTSLGLQQEQLNHKKIELDIEVAKKNIETLNKLKPVSDSGGGGTEPLVPDIPDDNNKGELVYSGTITSEAVDQYKGDGDGTADNPYIFLVRADADGSVIIDPSFVEALQKLAGQAAAGSEGQDPAGSTENTGDSATGSAGNKAAASGNAGTGTAGSGSAEGSGETGDAETSGGDVYFCLKNVDENDALISAWIGNAASLSTTESTKLNMSGGGISASGLTVEEIAAVLSAMQLTDEEKAAIMKAAGIELPDVTPSPEPTEAPVPSATPSPEPADSDGDAGSDADSGAKTTSIRSNTGSHVGKVNVIDGIGTARNVTAGQANADISSAQLAVIRQVVGLTENAEKLPAGGSASDSAVAGRTGNTGVSNTSAAPAAVLTADAATAVLTADTSSSSGSGSSGSDDTSGYSELIPSNAEYTAADLAQAKKDEQEKLDGLQLDLKESDLKIAQTQKDLDAGTVRAKMNGVVKTVGDPKNIPKDGSAFITVTASEGMYITSAVAESMLDSVHEGDSVTVMSWTTGNTYDATISDISPYPDTSGMYGSSPTDSYYPFTAYINTPDAQLSEGDGLDVTLNSSTSDTGMTDDSSLYLMKAFIREENGTKYVWKRGDDGKLTKQNVKTGKLFNDSYEILSGLSADDWVAFPYGNNVKEGAATTEGSVNDLYSS